MPFWPPCCEGKANLLETFRPANRAEVLIWENFHPGCRGLGCRNQNLGNWAGPPSHMFYKRNRSEARSR